MKNKLSLILPLMLLIFISCDQGSQMISSEEDQSERSQSTYEMNTSEDHAKIPNRFIITLEPKANPAKVAAEYDVKPDYVYRTLLKGFAGEISEAARAGLLRDNRVVRVEKDGVVTASATQNNPTWGLDRVDQGNLPLDDQYVYNADGSGVDAYIIDTGILYTHQDFQGRVNMDFYFDAFSDGQNGNDCNGHGTHVAGTVGGAEYGVAKGVNLIAVRVLDCEGSGTFSGVIAGMDWVAENASGPSVANMSLGGGSSESVDDAVGRMYDAGVPTVVAAGNGDWRGRAQDACGSSPAGAANAYTVGATDDNDTKTSWSNYGSCVDMFAPGANITSTWYTGDTATNTISGTSMASPHVAGVAALYLQNNTNAGAQDVYDAITQYSTKNIVSSSSTTNNHMVYSILDGSDGGSGGDDGGDEPVNENPVASFTFECTDLTCDFDGSGSSDSDGTVTSYSWDFGDGNTGSGVTASHTYSADGTYTATLTVTDDAGATGSSAESVSVSDSSGGDGGGDVGSNDPVVDNFSASSRSTGPWLRSTTSWAVSDVDGDLDTVVVEMLDGSNVVDSASYSASGGSASGETELRTRGSADSVSITVTDSNGNTTTQSQAI